VRAFHSYFLRYLFNARTRQGLLFLALGGLFLSAMALTVVQGVMGGLQNGLIARSRLFEGDGVITFQEGESALFQEAIARGLKPHREIEVELLARHGGQVAPVVLHGVDPRTPLPFLAGKDLGGLVLGADLAQRLRVSFYGEVRLVTPAVTEALMGELPRQLAEGVTDYLVSEVSELDGTHAWARLSLVQNLLRTREANQWRFFGRQDFEAAREWLEGRPGVRAQDWEERHGTLVWALNLETRVMLALFISMALLVALAITTGLTLFFARIRRDLAGFWILGLSLGRLHRLSLAFVTMLSALVCAAGVGLGSVLLLALTRAGATLMPDVFVERSLPVQFSPVSMLVAFLVPFLIALVFSLWSLWLFRKENRTFIHLVRGAGQAS
jgi:lipoprotein-releasing system permease protein